MGLARHHPLHAQPQQQRGGVQAQLPAVRGIHHQLRFESVGWVWVGGGAGCILLLHESSRG